MAKTKPNTKPVAKTSISISAIFQKATIEALRQEHINEKQFAVRKSTKSAKSKSKKKQKSKAAPEHQLAAAFSDTIEHSRDHIQEQAFASLNAAYANISERLADSEKHFAELEAQAIKYNEAFNGSLKDEDLPYTSNNGRESGTTKLGRIMKKLENTIAVEEREVALDWEQLWRIHVEIHHLTVETIGEVGVQDLLANPSFDASMIRDAEQTVMEEEIEAARKKYTKGIEELNKATMQIVKASEKELRVKQREAEDYFITMMREDEYCL